MRYIGITVNVPPRKRRRPTDARYSLAPFRVAHCLRMNADNPANDLSRTIFTGLRLQTDAGMVIVHIADVSFVLDEDNYRTSPQNSQSNFSKGCLPLRFSNPDAHFRRAAVLPEGVWDCCEGAAVRRLDRPSWPHGRRATPSAPGARPGVRPGGR